MWRYQRYFAPSCMKEYLRAERQLSGHCYGPFLADRALLHPKRIHLVMSLNFVKSCDAFLIVTENLVHGRPSNYSLQYVASPGDLDSVKAIQRSQHGLLVLHWCLLGSGSSRPAHQFVKDTLTFISFLPLSPQTGTLLQTGSFSVCEGQCAG